MFKPYNKILLFAIMLFSSLGLKSQDNNLVGGVSIADDTIPPHPSAILDIRSASKGVLLPQMEHADLKNVQSAANGLMVYVTDTSDYAGIWFHLNGDWQQLKFRKAYYPKGSIIMYNHPITGLFDDDGRGINGMEGWHICNGKDGTPDLTDRFVVGLDLKSDEYKTYGSNPEKVKNEYVLEDVPDHTHSITDTTVSKPFNHSHALLNSKGGTKYTHKHELQYIDGRRGKPGHQYQRRVKSKDQKEYAFDGSGLGIKVEPNSPVAQGNINLAIEDSGVTEPEPFDNRPAYYTLVYIIRTGPSSFPMFNEITIP